MPRLVKRLFRGFTLIELLVVITIISLIGSAFIFSTENTLEKGRDERRKEELGAISSALSLYFVDHKEFPFDKNNANQLDFVSYPYTDNWIPGLGSYMQDGKLPKDPLAGIFTSLASLFRKISKSDGAVAASQSISVTSSEDDAKWISYSPYGPPRIEIDDTALSVGRPFVCNEIRNNYMRFTGVQIPANATITDARIVVYPRDDSLDGTEGGGHHDDWANSQNPSWVKTRFQGEKSLNATQITNVNDFSSRPKTTASIQWNNIPIWFPTPSEPNRTSPSIASVIQEIISQPGWSSSSRAINIYWLDNGSGTNQEGCSTGFVGRIGTSYDGWQANVGAAAPRLDLTWTVPAASPTPTPTPVASSLPSIPPAPSPSPPGTNNEVCNGKINIYCYRVSEDKKSYVLWAQLENLNDPQLYTKPGAVCNSSIITAPDGNALNYCLISPLK